jgi:hypothetical protein
MAVGGATRANPTAMGTILTAPATLALTPRYEVAVGGRLGTSKVRRIEAAATDSSTGPLTLGLMYIREGASFEATPDELPGWLLPGEDTLNPYTETTVGGGVAMSWLNRHLALGAGGRFSRYASRFSEQHDDYAFNASLGGQVQEQLFLALTGENLYSTDPDDDLKLGSGIRWQPPSKDGTPRFGVETDLVMTLGDAAVLSDIHAGLEVRPSPFVPLRAGFHRDQLAGADHVTAGIGAGSQEALFEYATSVQLSAWEHSHTLSLRLFF